MIPCFLGTHIKVNSEKIHVLSKEICRKTILTSYSTMPNIRDTSCSMNREC